MNSVLLHIFLLVVALSLPMTTAAQSFEPLYGPARSPHLASLQRDLQKERVVEKMAAELSQGVRLPRPITLASAECGSPNAFYSKQHNSIVMCLDLFHHLAAGIGRDLGPVSTPEEIGQTISGAFAFVLLHELGHALIDQLNLPVLGREEDAADQISLFLVLRTPVAPQALAGALWFFRQKTLFYSRQHFSGEHSLGPQRQTNLACWAYGSNTAKYGYLLNGPFLPRNRAVRCVDEYKQLDSAVRRLLAAHVELPALR
jgi:hypothetical protein